GKRLFDKHELFAPYAERLGKACFVFNPNTCETKKYRVVAMSHKGAISIRRWDDGSGKHAFWVRKKDVAKNVRFTEGGE
ncbi:MAG: hypothetical protein IJH04_05550, partial [Eggerthellaceae bacterium]|nr:hypothetical protein [Eggerthellaceae bacterium]